MPLLLIIFIAVPIIEIIIFIRVGEYIGIFATIGLVIITAIVGTSLLRSQGLSVVQNVQNSLNQGRIPVDSMIDGVCLIVAGAFLITPGLLTDTVGFLLFIQPLRRTLAKEILKFYVKRGKLKVSVFGTDAASDSFSKKKQNSPVKDSPIIETDYQTINKNNKDKTKGSSKEENDNTSHWRTP